MIILGPGGVFRFKERTAMSDGTIFSRDLFDFLTRLAENNNRIWFNEHKENYNRSAKEPMLKFIGEMGERLPHISPSFRADTRTNGGSMYRIYRDTRFAKQKKPYKENVGCQFHHIAGKDAHAPGFYLHLQPGNCFAGGGIWRPPTSQLTMIRERIAANSRDWIEVKRFLSASETVAMMQAESLKRAPRGFDPGHPLIDDIKQKSFFAGAELTEEQVCGPDFNDRVEHIFLDLIPFMGFLTEAVGLSFS